VIVFLLHVKAAGVIVYASCNSNLYNKIGSTA